MYTELAVIIGLLVVIIVMTIFGATLTLSDEEILEKYGCEIVPIETKMRRLEILSQGLEAKMIGIESNLEKLKLIQADLEIISSKLTDIQLSGGR